MRDDDAYERAKAGGKHAGMLARYNDMTTKQVERSLRSFQRNVSEHERKIMQPEKYVAGWHSKDPREQKGILNYWEKDIERNQEQAIITKKYLNEHRGSRHG